jgi:hypothetical protein
MMLLLPVACAVEGGDEDDTGGAENGGTASGTAGLGGKSGAGGGGANSGGAAGSLAGSGGKATGGTGGLGGAGTGGGGSPAGAAGAAGAGGAGGAGSGGLGGGGSGGAGGNTGGGAGTMAGSSAGGTGGSAMAGAGGAFGGAGQGGKAGASGAAGTAGAGGGGSSGFDPCPATGPCKILPLGDSITDGIGFSGGYRVELFSRALADDKEITFVGGSMNGPQMVDGQAFPRAHEGHSGWTIQQIDGIVPDPALGVAPHIVLLHIGTNDMYQSPNGAPDRLGALIDQIVAELPDALLVVSTIIPLPMSSGPVNTFNAAVPGVVNARKDAGKHVLLVDQFTGFPTNELGDGVHPNEAGYARMAGVWYTAISSYLH